MPQRNNSTCVYKVLGTHCRSCELLIEKEISTLPHVKSVSASSSKGKVEIISAKPPTVAFLNNLFKESGYTFSLNPTSEPKTDIYTSLLITLGLLAIFYFIQKTGVLTNFNVNTDSLLPSFFIFGLVAGFSTCAALVGGIVLSLSKQWGSLYSNSDSTFKKLQPVLMFNLGRLFFFSLFGGLLGYFGSFFHLSLTIGAIVTILVSVLMLVLGLQMVGVPGLSSFQLALPKSFTSRFVDETKFQGRYMPLIMGGLTFFLPCGFTLTSQSLALASGSWLQGALIMGLFSLGTFLPLLLIGYGGVKSQSRSLFSKYLSQIAGLIVIVFALFNFSSQLNVLGFNPIPSSPVSTVDGLAPVVNGKYLLKMDASSTGYTPSAFTVKAGQPIRWEITDKGASGCTNAVISRTLFDGPINLVLGTTSVKEFTAPTTPGTYRFSCWMGMINGTIEVVN